MVLVVMVGMIGDKIRIECKLCGFTSMDANIRELLRAKSAILRYCFEVIRVSGITLAVVTGWGSYSYGSL